jgi:hypothetical protein
MMLALRGGVLCTGAVGRQATHLKTQALAAAVGAHSRRDGLAMHALKMWGTPLFTDWFRASLRVLLCRSLLS